MAWLFKDLVGQGADPWGLETHPMESAFQLCAQIPGVPRHQAGVSPRLAADAAAGQDGGAGRPVGRADRLAPRQWARPQRAGGRPAPAVDGGHSAPLPGEAAGASPAKPQTFAWPGQSCVTSNTQPFWEAFQLILGPKRAGDIAVFWNFCKFPQFLQIPAISAFFPLFFGTFHYSPPLFCINLKWKVK